MGTYQKQYFFYLYLGFVFILGIIYIGNPVFQWIWNSFLAYYAIWISVNASMVWRRNYMEQYDEALLASVSASTNRALTKQKADAHMSGYAPISTEIVGSVSDSVKIEIEIHQDAPSYTLGLPKHQPPRLVPDQVQNHDLELTALELEIQEKQKRVSKTLHTLAKSIGASVVHGEDLPIRQRYRNQIFQFVTSACQLPYQITPSFMQHLTRYRERARENAPPPTAELYTR